MLNTYHPLDAIPYSMCPNSPDPTGTMFSAHDVPWEALTAVMLVSLSGACTYITVFSIKWAETKIQELAVLIAPWECCGKESGYFASLLDCFEVRVLPMLAKFTDQ